MEGKGFYLREGTKLIIKSRSSRTLIRGTSTYNYCIDEALKHLGVRRPRGGDSSEHMPCCG